MKGKITMSDDGTNFAAGAVTCGFVFIIGATSTTSLLAGIRLLNVRQKYCRVMLKRTS